MTRAEGAAPPLHTVQFWLVLALGIGVLGMVVVGILVVCGAKLFGHAAVRLGVVLYDPPNALIEAALECVGAGTTFYVNSQLVHEEQGGRHGKGTAVAYRAPQMRGGLLIGIESSHTMVGLGVQPLPLAELNTHARGRWGYTAFTSGPHTTSKDFPQPQFTHVLVANRHATLRLTPQLLADYRSMCATLPAPLPLDALGHAWLTSTQAADWAYVAKGPFAQGFW